MTHAKPAALLLGLGLGLLSCASEGSAKVAQAAVAPSLKTAAAETADWTPSTTLDGTLQPVASVQLGFDVPGRIEKLHVERGSVVTAGQAIASLDDRMARAQLAQAEGALKSAEAQLAAGEAAWARAQQLKAAGGLSDQQFKDAEASILAGRAGIEQARAGVQLARTYVSNHTLRAPITGTITNGPDNAGMLVGAGTVLFMLEDLTALQLKASVSEYDGWVREGMTATLTSGTPGAGETASATVLRVIPALDPVTRRLPVELRLTTIPEGFRAHGYARATLSAAAPVTVIAVPKAAVVARPDFSVIVDRGAGKYERVTVELLGESGERSLVRGKLNPGENVVLYPPSGLGGEG